MDAPMLQSADSRPVVLFVSHPLTGHLTPALRIAGELRSRGWSVYFLGPTAHRTRISASGVTFVPLQGLADLDDLLYYSADNPNPPVPNYASLSWQHRALMDMKAHCIDPLPDQWNCFKRVLLDLHKRHPGRQVVVVSEAFFHGILPLYLGANLPDGVPAPRTLCLSVTVPVIRSIDLPPFGYPFPFDQTAEGRARNAACWERWEAKRIPLKKLLDEKLIEAGATHGLKGAFMSGANYLCHDRILQLGVPSFYHPRSDWPSKVKFVGIIPPAVKPPGGWNNLPVWWEDIVTQPVDAAGRKVVVVAQGTVECDPHDLIIPTIQALAGRKDVLVVAILGRRGATLPSTIDIPDNARIVDYLGYDAILPYAHCWVHNAGYGAVTHGIAHGVPVVVGGEGQDKTENAKRVAYSGIGIDLGTPKPKMEDIKDALETVLADGIFQERVNVLKKEAQDLDCFHQVENAITALVDLSGSKRNEVLIN